MRPMNPDGLEPLSAELVADGGTEAEAIARLAVPDVTTQPIADWLGGSFDAGVLASDVLVAVSKSTDDGKPAGLTMDLEPFRMHPRRAVGSTSVERLESLKALAGRHWVEDQSTAYVDAAARDVEIVFDDHGAFPGWGSHRAIYAPQHTPEFKAWQAINRTGISQEQLAEFLADWQHTIAEPDAADVYEIAQRFEATTTAKFERGARLATGARQLVYVEDVAAKSGELEIPESLTLSLRLFTDPFAPTIPLKAALRFVLREGALTFRVVLEPLEPVFDTYFEQVATALVGHGYDVIYGRSITEGR